MTDRQTFLRYACTLVALCAPLAPHSVRAQDGVRLGIERRGTIKPSILVLPIRGDTEDSLATILSRDFDFSDRFTTLPPSRPPAINGPPDYMRFASLGTDYLVQATPLPSGWLRVALHDVRNASVERSQDFPLPSMTGTHTWRSSVHAVSDAITEWLTFERGIAQTQIAFERDHRIWIVDSDGANPHAVTSAGMSASWAPVGRTVVYSGGNDKHPGIYVSDLSTGATREATKPSLDDMDVAPAVSRDGRTIAFARILPSGTELFTTAFSGQTPSRITVGRGSINTQPSFSPDSRRLAFASDRTGSNAIYVSDADGTSVEPLCADGGGGDENAPDWSPDGRLIAFQKQRDGVFQVMVTTIRTKATRIITSDGRNDSPSWAPDSRHLVVTSTRSGTRQLWVVDVETGRARQLTFGAASRLAAWSPRPATP